MADALSARYVLEAASHQSGIPVELMTLGGFEQRLAATERNLVDTLVGQGDVIRSLCADLRQHQKRWFSRLDRQAVSLEWETGECRPRFSALLMGPTGTGKTQLAHILAQGLFEGHLIMLRGQDVSETSPHGVSAWVGAPPSYVGHGEGGCLTNGLRAHRCALICFDELEKASYRAKVDIGLGLLGEGKVTDMNTGQSVDASQCIVLATSNIQLEEPHASIGFGARSHSGGIARKAVYDTLCECMPSELIGRFNGIYVFSPLTMATKQEILSRLILSACEDMGRPSGVVFDGEAEVFIQMRLGEIQTGARGIQDFFSSSILPVLSAASEGTLTVTLNEGRLSALDAGIGPGD